MTENRTIYLVSCVAGKRAEAMAARDLYASEWFFRARAFVERAQSPWFILSARYGLVAPHQIIAPYEQTLNTMRIAERRLWAGNVRQQMELALPDAQRCVVLAGVRYREFLMGYLNERFVTEVPMRGLAIGKQLQWLPSP